MRLVSAVGTIEFIEVGESGTVPIFRIIWHPSEAPKIEIGLNPLGMTIGTTTGIDFTITEWTGYGYTSIIKNDE